MIMAVYMVAEKSERAEERKAERIGDRVEMKEVD